MKCPHCQHDNPPSAKFCIECGFRIASDQAIVKSLPEERKFITVLFVDIPRFTSISEQMDPEQVRDLINDCFNHLLQTVKKYGGKLEKYVGDAFIAVFGVPFSHENDPERAIRAGLEMIESISDFNSTHGTDLNLHVGINTGMVIVGGIGISERHEVMSDTVNIASRLKDFAKPGQILVGSTTYLFISACHS